VSGKREIYNDYRFSTIPGRAVTDARLERGDIIVLALLGRHTKRHGWCCRSQVVMAEELRCGRGTVQRALDRLVEAGYVQKKANGRGRREAPEEHEQPFAPYSYRIIFDYDEAVADGAHQWAGEVPAQDGQEVPTIDEHEVPTSRAPLKNVSTEGSLQNDQSAREDASLLGEEGSPQTNPKKPSPYPSAFERWWSECRKWPGFSPNMSKPDALKAWNQAETVRPPTGDMARAAIEYRRWLEAENETRAKRRDKPHPTLHPATWLRQRRWTGFLEAAALRLVDNDPPRRITLAPQHVEALRNAGLSEVTVATWFADGEYRNGKFLAASDFKRGWIEQHYMRECRNAFGANVTITVKEEPKGKAA
jgi:hypothetical protein